MTDVSDESDVFSMPVEGPHKAQLLLSAYEAAAHAAHYYIEDGDCVILVETKLFKVHRSFLMRDESIFCSMFSLPQNSDNLPLQGSDDSVPIVLSGDTPKEFDALCWALYSLPDETLRAREDTTAADFSRLLCLAKIALKYTYLSLVKWSVDILVRQCSLGRHLEYDTCPNHVMGTLMDVAVHAGRSDLRIIIEEKWISRLMSDQKVDRLLCRDALDSAEKHNLRKFMGQVYYITVKGLCRIPARPANTDAAAVVFSSSSIFSDLQMHRILSGFCSLVFLSERFIQDSAKFCDGFCHLAELEKAWETSLKDLGPFMPVHLLERIAYVREGVERLSGICNDCRDRALDALLDHYSYLRENLADHFIGPQVAMDSSQ